MRRFQKGLLALLSICLIGCSTGTNTSIQDDDVVSIASTYSLGTINPLNMDWSFINYDVLSMEFLPLATINEDYSLSMALAESIEQLDPTTFKVVLKKDAHWSDLEPITVDDVIYTILAMSSKEVGNFNFDFSVFEGIDAGGKQDLDELGHVKGLEKIDEKTMKFHLKAPMSMYTFMNNIMVWICILPSHVLSKIPYEDLLSSTFFQAPDVVSGPYKILSYDMNHFVNMEKNENYFMGDVKIPYLEFRILEANELVLQLQANHLDVIVPSLAEIPVSDRALLETMDHIDIKWCDPITDELTFFQTENIKDPRIRKAFVMGVNREVIKDGLLKGKGEILDGVIPSVSMYYDEKDQNIPYDPRLARQLLEEANFDFDHVYHWYISSSDTTGSYALQIIQQQLSQIGVQIELKTVDFATLLGLGGSKEIDLFSLPYTITPNDYYGDLSSLVDANPSWTNYQDETLHQYLLDTQTSTSIKELKDLYTKIDAILVQDLPLFSLYKSSNPGIVNKRLKNVHVNIYGTFNNIQDWEKE